MAPAFVQQAGGTATGTSTLTVTLAATGAGNCLAACIQCESLSARGGVVTGITLGGQPGNWSQVTDGDGDGDGIVWCNPGIPAGQTTVVITVDFSGGGNAMLTARVLEFSGLAAVSEVDTSQCKFGQSGSPASGPAAETTTQAAEIWLGCAAVWDTTAHTLTGPTTPWVNQAALSVSSGPYHQSLITSYQVTATTGIPSYTAAMTPAMAGGVWGASVVALAPSPVPPPVTAIRPDVQAARRASYW